MAIFHFRGRTTALFVPFTLSFCLMNCVMLFITVPKTSGPERKPPTPISAGLSSRYDELANASFQSGYPTKESIANSSA
jgi:hypothetical protein